MPDESAATRWGTFVALGAGGMLAVARLATYIDVVTDTDVGFLHTLGWWGSYLAGLGLLVVGAAGTMDREVASQRAWTALLVGLVILVLTPASPAPAFDLSRILGG